MSSRVNEGTFPIDFPNRVVPDDQLQLIFDFVANITEREIDPDVEKLFDEFVDRINEINDGRMGSVALQVAALALKAAHCTGAPDHMYPRGLSHAMHILNTIDLKHLEERIARAEHTGKMF